MNRRTFAPVILSLIGVAACASTETKPDAAPSVVDQAEVREEPAQTKEGEETPVDADVDTEGTLTTRIEDKPAKPAGPFEALRPEEIIKIESDSPSTQQLVDRVNGEYLRFQKCAVEHKVGEAFGVGIVQLELSQALFEGQVKVGDAKAVRAMASSEALVRCVEEVARTIEFDQAATAGSVVSRVTFETYVFVGPRRQIGGLFRSFDGLKDEHAAFITCTQGKKKRGRRAAEPDYRVVVVGEDVVVEAIGDKKVLKKAQRKKKAVDTCAQQTFGGRTKPGYIVVGP